MKPSRDASTGPYVSSEDRRSFLDYCIAGGMDVRDHPDPFRRGAQVYYQGHWMSLLWNKSFRRYTVDKRLAVIVQQWSAGKV